MKWLTKLTTSTLLVLILLGSASVALAQDGPAVDARRGGAIRGEVIAVGDESLTVARPNGNEITVNATDDTKVRILGQGEAEFGDIQVGNFVAVRGPRNDEGAIEARLIIVFPGDPRDLAKVQGKVTGVEGQVIVVENRHGSQRITTDAETKFRIGREEGSLGDIEVGHLVLALGNKQDDGSFVAKVVIAATKDQLRRHTLFGQVVSVDTAAGSLVVEARGNKDGTWTVQTTSETKYRVPNVENPTLADVPVDAHVVVVGKADDDSDHTGTARLIAVVPERALGRVMGKVTGVNDPSFTLQSRHRGEFIILTDKDTRYRTRGDHEVSFDDIHEGTHVIVIGDPVEGQGNTIKARIIGIKLEETDEP